MEDFINSDKNIALCCTVLYQSILLNNYPKVCTYRGMQIALFIGAAIHDWKARLEPVTYRMPFPDRRFRVGEILLRHGWPLVTRRDQTRRTFLLPRIIVVYRVLHASIAERFLHVLYVWKTFWQTSRSSRYGTRLLFCVKEACQSERTPFCSFAVLCLFLCWPTATHYRLLSLTFCSTLSEMFAKTCLLLSSSLSRSSNGPFFFAMKFIGASLRVWNVLERRFRDQSFGIETLVQIL